MIECLKRNVHLILLLFISFLFLTHRILEVPPGIETDEGSIAYNAALISQDLHDQNKRFLPVFILSSDKTDWKQPVLIYQAAAIFKIFGKSLFTFKVVNVIVALASIYLVWIILDILFKNRLYQIIGTLIFLTTPIFFITARIGNESIQPAFFSSLWLLSLLLYRKTSKKFFVAMAAFSLGVGFYSFKGMRLLIPVWTLFSYVYLFALSSEKIPAIKNLSNKHHSIKQSINQSLQAFFTTLKNREFLSLSITFFVSLLPFMAITPLLEYKYAGAVFDRKVINLESYRHYLHYWFSNINFTSLFTNPDIGRVYFMKNFGPYLLAVAPIFLIGTLFSIINKGFSLFVLLTFIFTPLLFGFAGSIDYSHRLVGSVPFFVIICVYGVSAIDHNLKKLSSGSIISTSLVIFSLFLSSVFAIINTTDFYSYYYLKYPTLDATKVAFGNNFNQMFIRLAKESKSQSLTPFVDERIYNLGIDGNRFYELSYFSSKINVWKLGQSIPEKSILLTQLEKLDGFKLVANFEEKYYILSN